MVCSRDTCIPKSKYPKMVNTKKVDAMWWVAQMVIYSVYGQCFEGCVLEEQNLSACSSVVTLLRCPLLKKRGVQNNNFNYT